MHFHLVFVSTFQIESSVFFSFSSVVNQLELLGWAELDWQLQRELQLLAALSATIPDLRNRVQITNTTQI